MLRRLKVLPSVIAVLVALSGGAHPAGAENLLVNPGFHTSLVGWAVGNTLQAWSPLDVDEDPNSGSARGVINQDPGPFTGVSFRQCVAVNDATEYKIGVFALVPPGQARTGSANAGAYFYANGTCSGAADIVPLGSVTALGAWTEISEMLTPPPGSGSVALLLSITKIEPGGHIVAHFDDACVGTEGDCTPGAPPPPYADWIRSPELPGFEAQVRITAKGAAPIQGVEELECIAETICARGALPGRPEIFAKVIGPRPNGFFWVQLIRFTPSEIEVWLRQETTGAVNYYRVDATTPGSGVLGGIEDREAYLP